MNQLQKETGNGFYENQPYQNKPLSLVEFNDPNRQKPNLLRINADNQDKKFLCLFWTIFLVFVVTLAIVSKTLPPAIKTITNPKQLQGTYYQGCLNPNTFEKDILKCGTFSEKNPTVSIVTRKLSVMNQFAAFWLYITPALMDVPITLDQNITYLVYGLNEVNIDGQTYLKKGDIFQNQTMPFQYTSASTSYFYAEDGKTIKGYKIFLGFIGQFPSDNILLSFKFSGPYIEFVPISNIEIQGTKISKSFTGFTIAIRYIFFVFSLIAAFLYIRKYKKIPRDDRIIEQKLIVFLSIFLIFFNDPLYPVTVLKENIASSFFSTLFVISFIVYLIFMWVIFYDRIYYEEGKKETEQIKLWKIIIVAVLFILLMVLYMLYAAYRLNNHPVVPSQKINDRAILILDVFAFILFLFIIVYILYRYLCICCDKQERLWRSDLFMTYSILFMVAMIIFILTDNALGAYRYDGTTIIFLYGLMNFYVWYLQYMYTPTKETTDELNQKRSLNSDEVMTVGTVEFNDININLDDNNLDYYGLKLPKQSNPQKTENQINRDNYKWGVNDGQKQKQRNFNESSSQENQTSLQYPRNFYQKKQTNKKPEQFDFFNEQHQNNLPQKMILKVPELQKYDNTNLLTLSNNSVIPPKRQQQFYHPQFSSQTNNLQEIDQKNLEIMSEYQSQKPNDDLVQQLKYGKKQQQKPKQQNGFGNFQLE